MFEKSPCLKPIYLNGIVIDPGKWIVQIDNKPISVTSFQFRLLYCLMSNSGKFLSRRQIIDLTHESDCQVTEHSIDVQIGILRKKLGDHKHLLHTKYRVGYGFMLHQEATISNMGSERRGKPHMFRRAGCSSKGKTISQH